MNNTSSNNSLLVNDDYQTYWINIVGLINENISRYFMPFIWLIGNMGSILNTIVFSQQSLRKSPCALYFIASNISQFFIFNFVLVTRILLSGFKIETIYVQIWYCKFRYYFFYVFSSTARYYTILASVDRYFASSRDALRRQWSSMKIAKRFIAGNFLFWCVIYIQMIVFYETYPNDCSPRKGTYRMFFSIYILFDQGIVPLIFMIIFGLLTYKNIQGTKQRVRPMGTNEANQMDRTTRKDKHFLKMLLSQISVYIMFNIFNPCFLLYQTLTLNISKSALRLEVEAVLDNMSYFLIDTGFALTFLTNILSSSLFRQEFMILIHGRVLHRQAPRQTTSVLRSTRVGP